MTLRGTVADALAKFDYPDWPDEVERSGRLEQADAAIEAARPGLHLDGFLDACRLFVPLYERDAWDLLSIRLRDRAGWKPWVDECDGGHAWWRYEHSPERYVSVVPINHRAGQPVGYMVTFSWIEDEDENTLIYKTLPLLMEHIAAYEDDCRGVPA